MIIAPHIFQRIQHTQKAVTEAERITVSSYVLYCIVLYCIVLYLLIDGVLE